MTGMPAIVVGDDAVLAAIRAAGEEPELEFHTLDDAEIDDTVNVLAAAGPHMIRDWVTAVLAQWPHITPGQLRELADCLLPEETPR